MSWRFLPFDDTKITHWNPGMSVMLSCGLFESLMVNYRQCRPYTPSEVRGIVGALGGTVNLLLCRS